WCDLGIFVQMHIHCERLLQFMWKRKEQTMKADAQTEAAVIAALEQFQHAAEQGDVESFLATCAPEADIVFIGTGADEKRVGRAELQRQLERDLSQSERLSFDFAWHTVSAAGSVAWVATTGSRHAQV